MKRSKLTVGAMAAAVTLGTLSMGLTTAGASTSGKSSITICDAYGDGSGASGGTPKIDVSGDQQSVQVSAPAGYLIDSYCVKAGTDTVIVPVTPPQASILLTAPNGKAVSHYSLHFIPYYNS
jgi:hypothetical protein